MIIESEVGESGRRRRPSAEEAGRRLLATYCVFERGVIEAAVTIGGELSVEQAERRRAQLVAWMVSGEVEAIMNWIGASGVRFLRTRAGDAAGADFRDSLIALEFAATLSWALGLRDTLGSIDRIADPIEFADRLPPPFGEGRPLAEVARLVPEDALAGALDYSRRYCWRAEMALLDKGSMVGAPYQVAALLRVVAREALDEGVIAELIEGDFPVRGVSFARLSEVEADRVSIVSATRVSALAWLLGEDSEA